MLKASSSVETKAMPEASWSVLRPGIGSTKVFPVAKSIFPRSASMSPRQRQHTSRDLIHSGSVARGILQCASAATATATAPEDTGAIALKMQLPPSLHVMCMGISIHNSDVSVREKVAIKMDEWVSAAQDLVKFSQGTIVEAAVLSTCNRFELYFTCEKSHEAESQAIVTRWLEGRSGQSGEG